MGYALTKHAEDMLREREIPEEWAFLTIDKPSWSSKGADGNTHCFKEIPERQGRVLHVIVNRRVSPNRIVTVFFDRKARRRT